MKEINKSINHNKAASSLDYTTYYLVLIFRRIVLPPSSFDSKLKFLENTRKSFGGGTFNVSDGALLERYFVYLKDEYQQGDSKVRRYFAAACIGLQQKGQGYWCLSSEVSARLICFKMSHPALILE